MSAPENKYMMPSDIKFILKPMEGKKAAGVGGNIDPRLFTGDNKLHAIMDKQTCLWRLKYDRGDVPPAMKQQFTGYSRLYRFIEDYYKRRNLELVMLEDNAATK